MLADFERQKYTVKIKAGLRTRDGGVLRKDVETTFERGALSANAQFVSKGRFMPRQAWHEVTLFYPGQVSWPLLISTAHAGAERIAQGIPVKSYHSPDQLAHYGVEVEYAQEILKQWRLTLLVGLLLFFAIGFALLRGTQSNQE